jgi:hypothetical protein
MLNHSQLVHAHLISFFILILFILSPFSSFLLPSTGNVAKRKGGRKERCNRKEQEGVAASNGGGKVSVKVKEVCGSKKSRQGKESTVGLFTKTRSSLIVVDGRICQWHCNRVVPFSCGFSPPSYCGRSA